MKKNSFVSPVFLVLVCLSLFLLAGCSSSDTVVSPDSDVYAGKLISSELLASYTSDDVNYVIDEYYTPWGLDVDDLFNTSTDVDAYRIKYYTTDIDGELIAVSGLVSIPSPVDGTYPVVQYHHGTQFVNDEVPSNFEISDEAAIGAAIFGAHGYVTSMPDYIGQGDSEADHPYLHSDSMARCCADMLKAVKEFCSTMNIQLSGKLFICGLSEGGHATMALQQYLETSDSEQPFELTGSAPIAGPYDIKECWDFWIEASPPGCSVLAAHLIVSYFDIYEKDGSLDDIFLSPYNTEIRNIDDGTRDGDELYWLLPPALPELLQADFISSVNSGEHTIFEDMELNRTCGFAPVTPTLLVHARDDELAPYSVSELAYNEMVSLGAEDIELIDLGPDIDHVSSIFTGTYIIKQWFDSMK